MIYVLHPTVNLLDVFLLTQEVDQAIFIGLFPVQLWCGHLQAPKEEVPGSLVGPAQRDGMCLWRGKGSSWDW